MAAIFLPCYGAGAALHFAGISPALDGRADSPRVSWQIGKCDGEGTRTAFFLPFYGDCRAVDSFV